MCHKTYGCDMCGQVSLGLDRVCDFCKLFLHAFYMIVVQIFVHRFHIGLLRDLDCVYPCASVDRFVPWKFFCKLHTQQVLNDFCVLKDFYILKDFCVGGTLNYGWRQCRPHNHYNRHYLDLGVVHFQIHVHGFCLCFHLWHIWIGHIGTPCVMLLLMFIWTGLNYQIHFWVLSNRVPLHACGFFVFYKTCRADADQGFTAFRTVLGGKMLNNVFGHLSFIKRFLAEWTLPNVRLNIWFCVWSTWYTFCVFHNCVCNRFSSSFMQTPLTVLERDCLNTTAFSFSNRICIKFLIWVFWSNYVYTITKLNNGHLD